MTPKKSNGRNAGHAAPAKTIIKYATDFIATCARYASGNGEFWFMFTVLLWFGVQRFAEVAR